MTDRTKPRVWNIRTVPEDLHRRVGAAARLEGITLQEFIKRAAEERVKRNESKRESKKEGSTVMEV